MSDIPVFVGGIIPDEDASELKRLGVVEIFGPGTPTTTIIDSVKKNARRR